MHGTVLSNGWRFGAGAAKRSAGEIPDGPRLGTGDFRQTPNRKAPGGNGGVCLPTHEISWKDLICARKLCHILLNRCARQAHIRLYTDRQAIGQHVVLRVVANRKSAAVGARRTRDC
jgi:hypothetical protein